MHLQSNKYSAILVKENRKKIPGRGGVWLGVPLLPLTSNSIKLFLKTLSLFSYYKMTHNNKKIYAPLPFSSISLFSSQHQISFESLENDSQQEDRATRKQ